MAVRIAPTISACVRSGRTFHTRSIAPSLSTPVGSPFASFTTTPPGGSGVAAVTPPSFSARLLQTIMWPSWRDRHVGWSPVAGSSRAFVGRAGGVHCFSSHAPSVSHSPGGRVFAYAATIRVKSAPSFVLRRSMACRSKPPMDMCVCASMNPGTTRRHLASMTTVLGPRIGLISSFEPTATIRPPLTARASASGRAGSPVQILAEITTRSAGAWDIGVSSALIRKAASVIMPSTSRRRSSRRAPPAPLPAGPPGPGRESTRRSRGRRG